MRNAMRAYMARGPPGEVTPGRPFAFFVYLYKYQRKNLFFEETFVSSCEILHSK